MKRSVTVIVDRPLGSTHPAHPGLVYPVNYGYVPGVIAADGEEQELIFSAATNLSVSLPVYWPPSYTAATT